MNKEMVQSRKTREQETQMEEEQNHLRTDAEMESLKNRDSERVEEVLVLE